MFRLVQLITAAALIAGVLQPPHASAQDTQLTVFAAASLKNALDEVDAAFTEATGIKVMVSYESSSTLIKQIDQGAPADVFISADLQWMDYATPITFLVLPGDARIKSGAEPETGLIWP